MEELKWFVMYTASRSEKKVADRLKERGLDVYLPMIEELRQWSDRKKKVQRAMYHQACDRNRGRGGIRRIHHRSWGEGKCNRRSASEYDWGSH